MDRYNFLEAVRKKHREWNKYLHSPSQMDSFDYCKVRNECTKTTISYEKNIVMNMKENPEDFWAFVRQKTKAKSGVSNLKDSQGVCYKIVKRSDSFVYVFIEEPPGQ